MTISHFTTSNTSIAKDLTIDDLDKSAQDFELSYGELLLIEANQAALGDKYAYVSSGRAIYFSDRAGSKMLFCIVNLFKYQRQ